ncbi:NADPH dehydrogenase NamA [Calidifontibacillus erzurumensis]|uniref:NADPH dehydrogenase NamA n=1 Tax=Calidifontibacillus erzurumensis TaxID=2741433 RepID=A0A8J8KAU4_9BACI|nr:NADPH dehydrogenase NamA [Calidifontibacillus erzurumensis]NSL50423.1 NADPH dehydrogenase NamA [Calidifontibacillus erzurumensis]
MASALLSPFSIKNVIFKNRVVMSPMCMYSSHNEDGKVQDFHLTHYTSRAVGQVGLIILEATAVVPEGRISNFDLGIWDDDHIEGLKKIVDSCHQYGAKVGIQLAHAGRKALVDGDIFGPSAIAYSDKMRTPKEMTIQDIEHTVNAFQNAARRAKEAGFDVIEIHAAHGYLLHEFLSPITNKRTDLYGETAENRYRLLKQVIDAIRKEWQGLLFVRISATDYHPDGLTVEDYLYFAEEMKKQEVDLIDCSTGGLISTRGLDVYPGYQVQYAEKIKRSVQIYTGAVGLITSPLHAEEIIKNGRADLVFLGRELLRNPYWVFEASKQLQVKIEGPKQYELGWR